MFHFFYTNNIMYLYLPVLYLMRYLSNYVYFIYILHCMNLYMWVGFFLLMEGLYGLAPITKISAWFHDAHCHGIPLNFKFK